MRSGPTRLATAEKQALTVARESNGADLELDATVAASFADRSVWHENRIANFAYRAAAELDNVLEAEKVWPSLAKEVVRKYMESFMWNRCSLVEEL